MTTFGLHSLGYSILVQQDQVTFSHMVYSGSSQPSTLLGPASLKHGNCTL